MTRWDDDASHRYVARFRQLAADGVDLAGEARFVDAVVSRGSRILDAGCGSGRVGGELFDRGHSVVGIDADSVLIDAAEADHPGPRWIVGDLSVLALDETFDAAVVAGNVMLFVAPGTEGAVLARIAAHIRPDGVVIVGFGTARGYDLTDFDRHADLAGLVLEHRFATWELRPWHEDASFVVSVFRRPS